MGAGRVPGPAGDTRPDSSSTGYDWNEGIVERRREGLARGTPVAAPTHPTSTTIGAMRSSFFATTDMGERLCSLPERESRCSTRAQKQAQLGARLISWTLACFGAIALLMSSCARKREGDADPARRITTEASLTLPAGAHVLQFSEPEAIVDPVWAAKLELPEASFADFMSALDAKQPDKTSVNNRFAKSVAWWQPKSPLASKQYLANPQTLVNVVVSKEDGKVVAYVECMVF